MAFPTATAKPTIPQTETFTYREIATALIKARNLREGIWMVDVNASIQGLVVSVGQDAIVPALMVPLLRIGLCRCEKVSAMAVDAAQVNP